MQTVAIDTCFTKSTKSFLDAPEDVSDDELGAVLSDMTLAVSGLGAAIDRQGEAIDRLEVAVGHLVTTWGTP
jgi:hypothetical protein